MRSPLSSEDQLLDALLGPYLAERQDCLERRAFQRGDLLAVEGSAWPGLDLILSGSVAVIRGPEVDRQVIGLLRRGDLLDVAPLVVRDERCWFTARGLEAGVLIRISADRARSLVVENPGFQRLIAEEMATHLSRLARLVHDLAFKDVSERLASWLCQEAAVAERTSSGEIVLPRDLSLRDLASLLGTAREVVSRSFARLAKSGAVRLEPGRIVITDQARLEALARRS